MDRAGSRQPPARFGVTEELSTPRYRGATTQSLYLTMRDGVRIAIDVILPRALPADVKLPTVMFMTCYFRSFELRGLSPRHKAPMGPPRSPAPDFLVSHGYAVVTVDARGLGASFGRYLHPWSRDEIEDYGEVAAWIVQQPWSNGRVGAIGLSYEGTAAQLLAAVPSSAVKAVIAQQIEFDLFTDVVLPGGIRNEWLLRLWSDTKRHIETNRVPRDWGLTAGWFVKGVRPVDADTKRLELKQAVAEHSGNVDVYEAVKGIQYRDDAYDDLAVTLDDMSVFRYKEQIEGSGVAIFGWGSWLDGATADTVIRRFVNFSNPQRAVIGAWNHTMEKHGSPYRRPRTPPVPRVKAQWQEDLAFFDRHLRDNHDDSVPHKVLFYFTMGEEKWKTTTVWPVAGLKAQRWYLRENHTLSREPPTTDSGRDTYAVDFEATTGMTNRWHTGDGVTPVVYRNRASMDQRLLTYTGHPLGEDTEITGYPLVSLHLASTCNDGAFYAYLEEVDEWGKVTYITEGQLRAVHRRISAAQPPYRVLVPYHSFHREDAMPLVPGEVAELTFGLLPTSVLVKKGHRLRLAIAGHDMGTFARIPEDETPVIVVDRNRTHASFIEVPVIGSAAAV